MDGARLDGITRALATGATRRRTLQGLAGGKFAGLLAHFGIEEAAAACVKAGKKGCQGPQHKRRCKGARCTGGTKTRTGRCVCTRGLTKCGAACVNTENDRTHCGACNKKCRSGHTCKRGKCTSKLGCRAGQNFCNGGEADRCPGDLGCLCLTDVNGNPHCSDFAGNVCSDCTSNGDCGPGLVCYDARSGFFPFCDCTTEPGSNGNACISPTCRGISGSGTGRRPADVSPHR